MWHAFWEFLLFTGCLWLIYRACKQDMHTIATARASAEETNARTNATPCLEAVVSKEVEEVESAELPSYSQMYGRLC